MLSMLGLVLADNLIALFVFWELTTITSYLLIGFNHDRPKPRARAAGAVRHRGGRAGDAGGLHPAWLHRGQFRAVGDPGPGRRRCARMRFTCRS
jgi:NADH:ubiquinone oxidoreductase subunit 5 (subunit L)/multisubunit Na+/H+ antiporter MnhA subunit